MKKSALITAFTFALLCISCSHSRPEHFDRVEEAAHRDVAKVVAAKEGSMDREHAVLAIRVREYALRSNGHETEADLYLETARKLLVDSLHIIEDRQSVNEY